MKLTQVLNEMTPQQASISDFDKLRTVKPNGDAALYQLLMTACNFHTSIATIMETKGLPRATYHKQVANIMRNEASQYIRGQ
jgi:hypothetical protein